MAAFDPKLPLRLVVLALLMVTAEHIIGFCHQPLRLGDAVPQAILARFDLCRLLLSPRGALFGVRHGHPTIGESVRTRVKFLCAIRCVDWRVLRTTIAQIWACRHCAAERLSCAPAY